MNGHTIILRGQSQRTHAKDMIDRAPVDAVVTIREGKRTLDQNAKLWAMLTDIARARPEGRDWPTEIWKEAFMSALGYEARWMPGLDGRPAFPIGNRTSKLTKPQFADLITLIQEYGDRHGVRWTEGEFA